MRRIYGCASEFGTYFKYLGFCLAIKKSVFGQPHSEPEISSNDDIPLLKIMKILESTEDKEKIIKIELLQYFDNIVLSPSDHKK